MRLQGCCKKRQPYNNALETDGAKTSWGTETRGRQTSASVSRVAAPPLNALLAAPGGRTWPQFKAARAIWADGLFFLPFRSW